MDLSALVAEVGPDDAGPVVAVGGGSTADLGGAVDPAARAVRAPAGIERISPDEMTVACGAGTPVAELVAALAEVGQQVALPSRPGSTVGGALAVGRSALTRLGHGPVRDALLQARVVTAAGRLVKAGGPTVKNVSGYDLCRLLVGSLGTLAIMGDVILRTRPRPQEARWLSGPADPWDLRQRLHAPVAILWDGTTTWLRLEGTAAEVAAEAARSGLAEVDGPPAPPPHRWSLDPATLRSLRDRDPDGARPDPGAFLAEVGVGTVHASAPAPARPLDPVVAELHAEVKRRFDPTGRLAPGRRPEAV